PAERVVRGLEPDRQAIDVGHDAMNTRRSCRRDGSNCDAASSPESGHGPYSPSSSRGRTKYRASAGGSARAARGGTRGGMRNGEDPWVLVIGERAGSPG